MDARKIRPVRSMPREDIRARIAELRAVHGPQDWLTLAGSVTANAYRLAGMTGEEFAALLRSETGLINIQERRKPLMRLRAGFDPITGGVVKDENGIVTMFFHFAKGTYAEEKGGLCVHLDPSRSGLGSGKPPCRIDAIVPDVPQCLAGATARAMRADYPGLIIDVANHLETLALMPDAVAAELGVEVQRRTDQIPWLYQHADDERDDRGPSTAWPPPPELNRSRPNLPSPKPSQT